MYVYMICECTERRGKRENNEFRFYWLSILNILNDSDEENNAA